MATMTISLVIGADTYTKTVTLTNANAARLQAAYAALYQMDLPPSPTSDQIFQALANGVFQGFRTNVLSHEKQAQQPAIADLPIA